MQGYASRHVKNSRIIKVRKELKSMKILTKKPQQYIESKRDRIMNVIIKYACKDAEIDQVIENLYDICSECGIDVWADWEDKNE